MNLIIHEKLLKNLKILRVLPDYRKILESLGSIIWFNIAQLEIFYPEEKQKPLDFTFLLLHASFPLFFFSLRAIFSSSSEKVLALASC